MTDEQVKYWIDCGLSRDHRIQRIIDWANMLEKRVAELDPDYRGYQFGRMTVEGDARP